MSTDVDFASLLGEVGKDSQLDIDYDMGSLFGDEDPDMKSLFSGDDDLESLFGDHNHISSPFMEEEGEPTSRNDTDEGRPLDSTSTENQLTFPTSHEQSSENGGLALPMLPSQPVETALTLPTQFSGSSQTTGTTLADVAPLDLTFPTLEYSPSEALSTATLDLPTSPDPLVATLCNQDGHTSGNAVVSTTVSTEQTSSILEEPEINNGLESILEVELLQQWAISGQIQQQPAPGDGGTVSDEDAIAYWHARRALQATAPKRPKDFQRISLPRIINSDPLEMEVLASFVIFRRATLLREIYSRLDLDVIDGKRVCEDIKAYVRASPLFSSLLHEPGLELTTEAGKRRVGQIAYHLLIKEEWGSRWWGPDRTSFPNRKLFWPDTSTVISVHFITLVHRAVIVGRQTERNRSRQTVAARADQAHLRTIASKRPLPPAPSVHVFSQPPSRSQSLSRQASVDSSLSSSGETDRTPGSQSPPRHVNSVPLDILAQSAVRKKRKLDNNVAEIRYVLDIPADAELTYCVRVKDKEDGTELAPAATYRHQDDLILRGAFTSLKKSFEEAGQAPTILIRTAFTMKKITDEASWELAVLSIYNRNPTACVEVDVAV